MNMSRKPIWACDANPSAATGVCEEKTRTGRPGRRWREAVQAFVKYGATPFNAELRDIDVPSPGDHQVLLSVAGCGVCGSDLHAYRAAAGYEWVKTPVTLGHEFAGMVVQTGKAVRHFKDGDRVVVVGIQGCGHCAACSAGDTHLCADRKVIGLDMDGGMAAYAVVEAAHLIPVPDAVDPALGAMVEPLSVAVHALSKTVIRPGERVVVSGPGPIGLLCGMIAALGGATVVMTGAGADVETRLPLARRLGFETVNTAAEAPEHALGAAFNGTAPDIWVEASGSPQAFNSAVEQVRRGGSIVVVGMYAESFEWIPTAAVRSGLNLFFSYASAGRDYHSALKLMAQGLIDPAPLADYFSLSDAESAFREAMAGRTVKPVLVP